MRTWLLPFLALSSALAGLRAAEPSEALKAPAVDVQQAADSTTGQATPAQPAQDRKAQRVYVIPVREQIGSAVLYIVRRGLKEAIAQKADAVIFDLKTPGGALDSTLEIMEAIAKFPGTTIAYVNDEAISAGAFISASTDEIWFAPRGKIGAAAPVSATGEDIDETMRQKVVSYLKADIRSRTEGKGLRGAVISAMIDKDFELKIGDNVVKPKGELLTLTASEAAKTYGEPPQPLLSAGTAKDLGDLLAQRFDQPLPAITLLQVTWSEQLAVWLNAIAPLLLGAGILALYIEFKTPGFGAFGVVGIVCLALVFLSSFIAGLSGHEPMLVFALGVLLIAVEIFFMPGAVVFALTGVMLVLASLVWAMADIWPNEPLTISGDLFVRPMRDLGLGFVLAIAMALVFARFIPKGWFFTRLAVTSPVAGAAQRAGSAPAIGATASDLIGRVGVAVSGLYPGGHIEIEGRRYEARLEVGSAPSGTRVVVRRKTDFGLIVDRAEDAGA